MTTEDVAQQLLDRCYREADGNTEEKIDLVFVSQDEGLTWVNAEPALDVLKRRGLLDVRVDTGFLTKDGVRAIVDNVPVREFPEKMLEDDDSIPQSADLALLDHEALDEPEEENVPRLKYPDEEGNTLTHLLTWKAVIGRSDDVEITLHDKRASKRHCEIRYESGCYVLEDFESANGTMLNGRYVAFETLNDGDSILIGRTEVVFECPDDIPVPAGDPDDAEAVADTLSPPPPNEPEEVVPPPLPVAPVVPPLGPPEHPIIASHSSAPPADEVEGDDDRRPSPPASRPSAVRRRPAPRPHPSARTRSEAKGPEEISFPDQTSPSEPPEPLTAIGDPQEAGSFPPRSDTVPSIPPHDLVSLDDTTSEMPKAVDGESEALTDPPPPQLQSFGQVAHSHPPFDPAEVPDSVEIEAPEDGAEATAIAETVGFENDLTPIAQPELTTPDTELQPQIQPSGQERVGQAMGVASLLPDAPENPESLVSPTGPTEFWAGLELLKEKVAAAEIPGKGELLSAIDAIENHPFVRMALPVGAPED